MDLHTADLDAVPLSIIGNAKSISVIDPAQRILGIACHHCHFMAPGDQLPAQGIDPKIFRKKILGKNKDFHAIPSVSLIESARFTMQ